MTCNCVTQCIIYTYLWCGENCTLVLFIVSAVKTTEPLHVWRDGYTTTKVWDVVLPKHLATTTFM